eukprot:9469002-Lingulodinium_polyedra.AAC.1
MKRWTRPGARTIWLALAIATPHGRTHFVASSAFAVQTHWAFCAERANSTALLMETRETSTDAR